MDTFYVNQPWNSRSNTKRCRAQARAPSPFGKDAGSTYWSDVARPMYTALRMVNT